MTRAAAGVNGRKSRLMPRLKKVWALATCRAGSAAVIATSPEKGAMNGNSRAAPSTLNAMWATATRLASAVAPIDEASAVAQVPMLAPTTMATAPGSVISSWLARARARPMVAADEVTSALKKAAASTAMIGVSVATWSSSSASALLFSVAAAVQDELEAEEHEPEAEDGLADVLGGVPPRDEGDRGSRRRPAAARSR